MHESVTRHHFPVPGPSSDSSALTGDRVRERGAGNRADAPIHLIKRSQELGAGKYALLQSLSLRLFSSSQKKKKLGKLWKKKKKEKKKEKEKGGLPRERLTASNANENERAQKQQLQKNF